MIEYEDFRRIIKVMTDEEIRHVTEMKYSDNSNRLFYKRLILFVRDNPEASSRIAQMELYNEIKPVAFKQLVHRIKGRILDQIISDQSIDSFPSYDMRAKEILRLRKKLIQFDVLTLRSLSDLSSRLITKIIQKAKKYEYYDILVFALYKKMRISGVRSDISAYHALNNEINYYERCRSVFHKSEHYIRKLYVDFNSNQELQQQYKNLVTYIVELEKDILLIKSRTIVFNLNRLKCELYSLREDFKSSKKVLTRSINLLIEQKELSSNYEFGLILLNLGIVNIQLFDFEESSVSLKKSLPFLKTLEENTCRVYQYQFLLSYYSINTKASEKYLDLLNNYLYSGLIKHYFAATVRYYNACIKFLKEDYTSSYLLLNDVKELEQDKESYNIAIRILSIMNQIELEKYEIADNLIENLRKHHERVRKTLVVTKRDEKIIHILVTLSRHSYRFRRTYRVREEAFNLLTSLEKDYRWKILSPEMIVFHEWFEAKTRDEKYDHFKVMPAMKKKYSRLHKAFVSLEEDVEYTQ
jgi:hypothetical protein